jgi:hypothetical protein
MQQCVCVSCGGGGAAVVQTGESCGLDQTVAAGASGRAEPSCTATRLPPVSASVVVTESRHLELFALLAVPPPLLRNLGSHLPAYTLPHTASPRLGSPGFILGVGVYKWS